MPEKQNIRLKGADELKSIFTEMGEASFRAGQVHDWLWKKKVSSFGEMTNLPKSVIKILDENFFIPVLSLHQSQVSKDGTVKSAFRLHDGLLVEGVLIPQGSRTTACISSQTSLK